VRIYSTTLDRTRRDHIMMPSGSLAAINYCDKRPALH